MTPHPDDPDRHIFTFLTFLKGRFKGQQNAHGPEISPDFLFFFHDFNRFDRSAPAGGGQPKRTRSNF